MVKLRKIEEHRIYETAKHKVCESNQVGILYHVCTIDALAKYIVPNDILSGSGKYKNRILDNRTDIVSFTRNRNYVVSTRATRISPILFKLVIDGDLISENHKVRPYNDLAFNPITGNKTSFDPKELEQEEIVIGDIHPLSKFILSVEYCVNDHLFDCTNKELQEIIEDIDSVISYLSGFSLTYNKRLVVNSSPLPSFNSLTDCKTFVNGYLKLCKLEIGKDELGVLLSTFDGDTNKKIYDGFYSCLFPSMAKKAIPYMPVFCKHGLDLNTVMEDTLFIFPEEEELLKASMIENELG